jgi:Ca-activated chloride channel family protein
LSGALAAQLLARRRRRRYPVRFTGVEALAAAASEAPRWRRRVPPALFALAAAGVVLALARPQATVAVPVEQASVMLVTDVSRSMQATDVARPPARGAPRGGALPGRGPARAARGRRHLLGHPQTLQPPTTDREQVRAALAALQADGGTAAGDGLQAALDALEQAARGERRPPGAIVLLSDGMTTTGRDPVAVAREAGRLRVPVYTVALGTPDGVLDDPSGFGRALPVPPDPEALRQIATASGGQAFTAQDADQLGSVYERLGSPDRHRAAGARGDGGLRGRRPAAPGRRARRVPALVRAAAVGQPRARTAPGVLPRPARRPDPLRPPCASSPARGRAR